MARTTPTQAKANRIARRNARRATTAIRKAARSAHRNERHTVASHLRALGVTETTAAGMAATLRKKIDGPGTKGFAKKDGARRACVRYTRAQVLTTLLTYNPRKAAYAAARAALLDLAA